MSDTPRTDSEVEIFNDEYTGFKDVGYVSETFASQLERELSAANARIAELEKDAARYRWLREHSTQPAEPWSTHSNPESLDDAVDAALRGILG